MNRSEESGRAKQIVLICLLIIALFFVKLPGQWTADKEFWSLAMDVGHFFIFAALVFYFRGLKFLFSRLRTHFSGTAGGILSGLAVGIELIQPVFGRSASWEDLINGLQGIASALIAERLILQRAAFRQWLRFAGANLLILAAISYPWAREAVALCWRRQNFPVLGSFETEQELRLWSAEDTGKVRTIYIERSKQQVRHGNYALRLWSDLPAGRVAAKYNAGDKDWSAQHSLVFEVFNPGNEITLHVRIDDNGDNIEFHSRFNRSVPLHRGWNEIAISIAEIKQQTPHKTFALDAVRRMILFADLPDTRSLFVDHVRLQ